MIPSVYQEEEISLSCIIDITSQKKIEETLKQNNDNINKLNSELVMMNNILINKSIKDSLTNLYNHQYINEVLENLLLRTKQDKSNLCIMMLDIDYFKRVNDQFGHLAGDKVLVTICELISKNVRKEDFIGRYGGEEFLVILPGLRLEAAARVAEIIRRSIQSHDFGLNDQRITVSIGVAHYNGETSNVLINRADMLLYQAKSKGRNRVEIILEERAG
jgi:diguanylate cyclase (GGDEF)-like protein